MKKLSMMLVMTLSVTAFSASASQVTWTTGAGFISSNVFTTSAEGCGTTTACKMADQIAADAQNYFATGKMSELLAYKVSELKETAGDISNDEAVEILADFAHRTLELY